MDSIPEVINVRIVNSDTIEPIPNIAIKVRLYAKRKNDYYCVPSISNGEGIVEIRKSWLHDDVEKTRSLFPMDYSSTLDDCEPKMEFKVMSISEVDQVVKTMIKWNNILNIPEAEIKNLLKANNVQYEPASQIVNFNGQSVIDIELMIKSVKKK